MSIGSTEARSESSVALCGSEPLSPLSLTGMLPPVWWLLEPSVPAAVYGTSCYNIARPDEYIPEADFGKVLKVHLGTVIDMLCGGADEAGEAPGAKL